MSLLPSKQARTLKAGCRMFCEALVRISALLVHKTMTGGWQHYYLMPGEKILTTHLLTSCDSFIIFACHLHYLNSNFTSLLYIITYYYHLMHNHIKIYFLLIYLYYYDLKITKTTPSAKFLHWEYFSYLSLFIRLKYSNYC